MSVADTPDLSSVLTFAIVLAALRIAWIDVRRLEIELETLAVMAGIAALQAWLTQDPVMVSIRLFAGLAYWGAVIGLGRFAPGLSRMGAGDPPLIGLAAFLAAPHLVVFAVLAAAGILVMAGTYAYRRGKPAFRSGYPAAPPLLFAGLAVYLVA